eukprot:gene35191-42626_t
MSDFLAILKSLMDVGVPKESALVQFAEREAERQEKASSSMHYWEREDVRKHKERETDKQRKEREAEADRQCKEREAEADRQCKEREAEADRQHKKREAEADRQHKEREAEADRQHKKREADRQQNEREAERLFQLEMMKIQYEMVKLQSTNCSKAGDLPTKEDASKSGKSGYSFSKIEVMGHSSVVPMCSFPYTKQNLCNACFLFLGESNYLALMTAITTQYGLQTTQSETSSPQEWDMST